MQKLNQWWQMSDGEIFCSHIVHFLPHHKQTRQY